MRVLVRKARTFTRLLVNGRGELVALMSWKARSGPLGRALEASGRAVAALSPSAVSARLQRVVARARECGALLRRWLDADALVFYLPRRLRLTYRLYRETGLLSLLTRPKTLNEKIQWRKLYCPDIERVARCVDKYEMRARAAEVCGQEHVLPLLYAGTSVTAADIVACGDGIMIKPSHRSGQRIRIDRLEDVDVEWIVDQLERLLCWDYTIHSVEPWYGFTEPRVLIEPWLREESGEEHSLDCRFYVFGRGDGEPAEVVALLYSDTEHLAWSLDSTGARLPYDIAARSMRPGEGGGPVPDCFATLLAHARTLAEGQDMACVDFMLVNGTYYFTEITYAPGGGCGWSKPAGTQEHLGSLWHLDTGNPLSRLKWKHRAWAHVRSTEGVRRLLRRLYRQRDEFAMPGIERADYTDPATLPDAASH